VALLLLGACAAGFFLWLRYDVSSEMAATVRNSIGMNVSEGPPAPEAPPEPIFRMDLPTPEAPPPAEPITLHPELPEVEAPALNQVTWSDFTRSPRLWPSTLEITIDQAIPVRYREQNYGEMIFAPGQVIEVIEITGDGRVLGSINDNEVFIPASATNLASWFAGKHGEFDELIMHEGTAPVVSGHPLGDDAADKDLLTQLRMWTLSNYDTHAIEITPDTLILRWTPREEAEIDFRLEAREVARKYLLLGAEMGRMDNYANCEIRDRSTGELRGSNGIFIPKL
jgi:hypothetical protein